MFKAFLNDEGKKMWGAIFPDGMIPIQNPFPGSGILGSSGQRAQVYMVAWDVLTPGQRGQVINLLAEKFHASLSDVENQILEKGIGLPLRASLVSHTSLTGKGCKHKVSKMMQKRLGKGWRKVVDEQNKSRHENIQ